jgi:hypothetical protein
MTEEGGIPIIRQYHAKQPSLLSRLFGRPQVIVKPVGPWVGLNKEHAPEVVGEVYGAMMNGFIGHPTHRLDGTIVVRYRRIT